MCRVDGMRKVLEDGKSLPNEKRKLAVFSLQPLYRQIF